MLWVSGEKTTRRGSKNGELVGGGLRGRGRAAEREQGRGDGDNPASWESGGGRPAKRKEGRERGMPRFWVRGLRE